MPDSSLTEAIKEAYANAPGDQVILHTLALYHPDWRDDQGNGVTLYFVRDHANHHLTIEDTASRDSGLSKAFKAVAFEFLMPEIKTSSVPEITVKIDNVGGELLPYLDQAGASKDKVEVVYRPYLSTDKTAPQMNPPLALTLSSISVDSYSITGKARLADSGSRSFPNAVYELDDFPALANF